MLSNSRLRVLCVDDHEDSRAMLAMLLSIAQIEARTAGTGAEALALIERECFDLYVLDARLPDFDGFELCRRVRAFDPITTILFFSGAAFAADRRRGLEAGANAYVIKPDIEGLLGIIAQVVSADSLAKKIAPTQNMSFSPPLTFRHAAG